jgi:hypothetical protein
VAEEAGAVTRLTFRPLQRWVDPKSKRRRSDLFRAGYEETLQMLGYEAGQLGARDVVIQLAIGEHELRRDGTPRSLARPSHPGVVVSFESRFGPLRYATDRYHDWRANLRGIALSLEALLAVDRHGVTRRGEQYVGWAQLEPPGAGPGPIITPEHAAAFIAEAAGVPDGARAVLVDEESRRAAYPAAARHLHPDATTGDAELFQRLQQARDLLEGRP